MRAWYLTRALRFWMQSFWQLSQRMRRERMVTGSHRTSGRRSTCRNQRCIPFCGGCKKAVVCVYTTGNAAGGTGVTIRLRKRARKGCRNTAENGRNIPLRFRSYFARSRQRQMCSKCRVLVREALEWRKR